MPLLVKQRAFFLGLDGSEQEIMGMGISDVITRFKQANDAVSALMEDPNQAVTFFVPVGGCALSHCSDCPDTSKAESH